MTLFGDIICLCQNAVPIPATHFCWFWLLEAHSDNGKGRRRGGEGLCISQIQTPKHSSNAVANGCCAPIPSLGMLNTGPSFGFEQSRLYLFDFRAPNAPSLEHISLAGLSPLRIIRCQFNFLQRKPHVLLFSTALSFILIFAVDGIFIFFYLVLLALDSYTQYVISYLITPDSECLHLITLYILSNIFIYLWIWWMCHDETNSL